MRSLERRVETQQEGAHSDEIETSAMLAIDASVVDTTKAAVEYMPAKTPGVWSLDPKDWRYNPSGIYGDATHATAAKGRLINDRMMRIPIDEIEALRRIASPRMK